MTISDATLQNRPSQRENDWRLFLRLVPYARRHKKLLLSSILLLFPLSFAGAVQPILVGQAVSLIRGEETFFLLEGKTIPEGLNLLSILLLLTVVLRMVLEASQGFLVQKVGQQITTDIRNDLFRHVTSLASSFFDRTPVGKLITRLTSDVNALGEVFSTGAIGVITDLFSIVILAVAMFAVQWQLASMLVLMLFPVAGVVMYFQNQYRKANYRVREELSSLNAMLQENITGINIVQLFGRQRYNSEMFRENNQRYIEQVDRTIFHDASVSAILEWISLVAIAAVLWAGGSLVLEDALTFGTLSTFILFAQRLFNPLRQFAEKFTAIQAGFTAIERISDILNQPIEIRDPEENRQQLEVHSTRRGEIRFENVSFGYKPNEYVLKNLNFTIEPGEKVAIVGPTGAGKSSVIRLLCRLYETTEGRVLVDGIDVRNLPQAELRRHVGVILQDGFVFSGDIKSNIALGENYSCEQIREAAQKTKVDRSIEKLPQGYDTKLRQRGTNLSGGQKQLLAFARVAVRDPQILVLDEATASLDVATEALVQSALDQLLENRTAIIIAHRLSTIRKADRIFVFKQGELVEAGTHEELIRQKGVYASLYELQQLGT
ncbi:ABC transporter ATP-binding protein [Geitlerinema sp. PCC 9228]|jgi:ATP-binding cassette subfamily B protein|uniref:ABC transporter ATP-binding protein n=1 Tax=Geitlerinema sp. PCC 9228 TaxID=111611 RepID=UPI0008F99219|nr:ABC transporter ATP-binding protein [Geitlerinema sp. PCC 9228]